MKRTIATLGVVGLGVMGAAVSANAAPPDKITICHATSSAGNAFVAETINLKALKAHADDTLDIVPVNSGDIMPGGQNLSEANLALLANNCVALVVVPPVEPPADPPASPPADPPASPPASPPANPPADPPANPPADPPANPGTNPAADPGAVPGAEVSLETSTVVTPPVVVRQPAAAVPAPHQAGSGAAAGQQPKLNVGYNVQTAVGHSQAPDGIPAWLLGLTGLFAAGSGAVLWRGGQRARRVAG